MKELDAGQHHSGHVSERGRGAVYQLNSREIQ
jgi:hypothetical protein